MNLNKVNEAFSIEWRLFALLNDLADVNQIMSSELTPVQKLSCEVNNSVKY